MTVQFLETDVLIVGGGGAGFRAAIGAREKGAKAMLLSKGPLARHFRRSGGDHQSEGNSGTGGGGDVSLSPGGSDNYRHGVIPTHSH